MEYEYRIDSADCKNYIMAYNESIRLYEKMKVFGAVLLCFFVYYKSLYSKYFFNSVKVRKFYL